MLLQDVDWDWVGSAILVQVGYDPYNETQRLIRRSLAYHMKDGAVMWLCYL